MIKKIGIDIVENKRIANKINDFLFLNKILSESEITVLGQFTSTKRKIEYCCGRFASKEALFKALPKEKGPFNYRDITIANDEQGAPFVIIDGITDTIHLSISHETDYTVAIIIMEI